MKKVLVVLMIALFAAGTAFAADPAPAPAKKYGVNVGDNVKSVVLKSIDGKISVDLEQIKKKTLFVMVSTVCTACRTELDELKANAEKLKEKVDIFVVLIDMDPASAVGRLGELPWPVLGDPNYTLGNATGVAAAPSTVVIADGKIVNAKSGYRPDQWKEFVR